MRRAAMRIWPRRFSSVALVVSLIGLPSLCHASPPDPTWVAGLHDDGDHDDVVLEVADMVAAAPAAAPHARAPLSARLVPSAGVRQAPARRCPLARLDRAPPLA